MKTEDRLVVAADFNPERGNLEEIREKVLDLAEDLKGLGVYIKLNSSLRALGYEIIDRLHDLGLKVFADLKINDISNTMSTDGKLLSIVQPDLLTVMCNSGLGGMKAIAESMQGSKTEILGMMILTTFTDEDVREMYNRKFPEQVEIFTQMAINAGFKGIVIPALQAPVIRKKYGDKLTLNSAGIRPEWSVVPGDDQKRIVTIKSAMESGLDRIIIGRPILLASPNKEGKPNSRREAVERTLEEINKYR